MREKDFQIRFNHWLKAIYRQLGVFELKKTKTSSLPFSAVVDHQVNALWNAKHGVLVYKIPDVGYQNPFDTMCLAGVPAFVVIQYNTGVVYLIDIDIFIRVRDKSTVKSLSERVAMENSLYHFNLKSYNYSSPL